MKSRNRQTEGVATPNETIDIWRLLVEHDQKMKRKKHEVSATS